MITDVTMAARRLLLVLGSGVALNFDAFTRRQAITTSTAALLTTTAIPPLPCSASTKGGVQWSIDVPDSFAVQQQLASIVRVKVNSMFQADDPSSGADQAAAPTIWPAGGRQPQLG